MTAMLQGWNVFDRETPILTFEYSFGPGTATSLAVGGAQGLVVVSPPCRVAPNAYDDLAAYGPVKALVASNAFHHLGLPAWKKRFPDAAVFAPAQSLARVARRTELPDIRPLADAAAIAGANVDLIDMPHYKTGEVLVRIRTARGLVWYVTDFMMNLTVLPANPVARFAFKVSRSGPGLRFNNIAPLFMVQDKRALKRWLAAEFGKEPPRWLIPTHGDIVDVRANPDAVLRQFATT